MARRWARARGRHEPGKMNTTERAYAAVLDKEKELGLIKSYRFEEITLTLAKNCRYCPDFQVVMADDTVEFREVKACRKDGNFLCEDDALVKIKLAADKFHEYRFKMVGRMPVSIGGWRERKFYEEP